MIATAVAAVVVVAAAITILAVVGHLSSQKRTAHPSHEVSYSSQVVPPFAGVREPYGVAVDTAGNVYIANANNTAGNVSVMVIFGNLAVVLPSALSEV
jgi:DNA-binding beta-propeller fold protein YncE